MTSIACSQLRRSRLCACLTVLEALGTSTANASNSNVKREYFFAHGSSMTRTPCSGQDTRGVLA